jgi:hypothetical protein
MRILHTIGRTEPADILPTVSWQLDQGCQLLLSALGALDAAPLPGLTIVRAEPELLRPSFVLRGLVRQHSIELIHAHDEEAAIEALVCSDLCPIVRSLSAAETAALIAGASHARGLPYDHLLVTSVALREQLVEADLIEREHITVIAGAPGESMAAILDAYERAIVRSLTGRLIPARFVGGRPDLHRLNSRRRAAE